MPDRLVVLVPVLARPHRVQPLLANLAATTPGARVVFLPDPDDQPEIRAVRAAGGEMLAHPGGYAAKINHGVLASSEPLVFLAADDLEFHAGWFTQAHQALMQRDVEVVGVNDLIPRRPGRAGHATHFLVTREYAERPTIDGGRGPLCEVYDHSFVDDELIATAEHRGVYAYCEAAHVKHLHHMNAQAPDDETYRKGRARFRRDRQLFQQRTRLWT